MSSRPRRRTASGNRLRKRSPERCHECPRRIRATCQKATRCRRGRLQDVILGVSRSLSQMVRLGRGARPIRPAMPESGSARDLLARAKSRGSDSCIRRLGRPSSACQTRSVVSATTSADQPQGLVHQSRRIVVVVAFGSWTRRSPAPSRPDSISRCHARPGRALQLLELPA